MLADWLFWGFGTALGLAGLWLMYRSLFADRSKGRRRCPRCWYDLSGIESLRCSECGRTARAEMKLFKTRRHKRRAVLGLLVVIAGLGVGWGRQVQQQGWIRATPTTVLIALLPHLDDNAWRADILSRVDDGMLYQWEYKFLVDRCVDILEASDDADLLAEVATILYRIEIGGRNRAENEPWRSWALASELNPDTVAALAGLLESDDPAVRQAGIMALGQFTNEAQIAMPALLYQLSSKDPNILSELSQTLIFLHHRTLGRPFFPLMNQVRMRRWSSSEEKFFARFKGCGVDLLRAVPILEEGLEHESEHIRATSIWGLAVVDSHHDGVAEPILALADDHDRLVFKALVEATSVLPLDDQVRRILIQALETRQSVRWTALKAIEQRGLEAQILLPEVEALLAPGTLHQDKAIITYVKIGGDPQLALNQAIAGLEALKPASPTGLSSTDVLPHTQNLLKTLTNLAIESVEAQALAEFFLKSPSLSIRCAAAQTILTIGGDAEQAMQVFLTDYRQNPTDRNILNFMFQIGEQDRVPQTVVNELLWSDDVRDRRLGTFFVARGTNGVSFLDRLRELRSDPDFTVANDADRAVKRLEFDLSRER